MYASLYGRVKRRTQPCREPRWHCGWRRRKEQQLGQFLVRLKLGRSLCRSLCRSLRTRLCTRLRAPLCFRRLCAPPRRQQAEKGPRLLGVGGAKRVGCRQIG
jgi:hypothetical protein